ncbi:fimbrial protein [Aeromonas cavernicola]|uniref:Fimbrial protein n=1 Tax=Aeromonas cavernicola TaxID=1006623 RepID=A0A2H9U6G3_9GAMM|nr:fimbrial protein [Aeromonas cavernicola]PJG59646.1 fimbrial protein [Aeromonas cavernicola]
MFQIWLVIFLASYSMLVNAADEGVELLGDTVRLHGRIVERPCLLAPESATQSVEMGIVDVKELYADGNGEKVPFTITLRDCKPGIFRMARIVFSGTADSQVVGALAFSAGSAKGAAIRLYDQAAAPLNLGQASPGHSLANATQHDLKFYAAVVGQPSAIAARNIQPGTYSAVTNFVVSYE